VLQRLADSFALHFISRHRACQRWLQPVPNSATNRQRELVQPVPELAAGRSSIAARSDAFDQNTIAQAAVKFAGKHKNCSVGARHTLSVTAQGMTGRTPGSMSKAVFTNPGSGPFTDNSSFNGSVSMFRMTKTGMWLDRAFVPDDV